MSSRSCSPTSPRRRVSFSGSPPPEACPSRRSSVPAPRASRYQGRAVSPRRSVMVAVPVDCNPYRNEATAPPSQASIECVAQVVQERLCMQERNEYETLQRNLFGMQQFRRNYVMGALRDNEDFVLANLDEVMTMGQPPRLEFPASYAPIDAEQPPSALYCSESDPSEAGGPEQDFMGGNVFGNLSSCANIEDEEPPDFFSFEDSSEDESGYASGSCSSVQDAAPPAAPPADVQAVIQAAAQVVALPNNAAEDQDYLDFAAGLGQCRTSSFY